MLIGEGVSCFVCVCRGVVQVDPSVKQQWLGNGCGWWCEGFSKLIALPTAMAVEALVVLREWEKSEQTVVGLCDDVDV